MDLILLNSDFIEKGIILNDDVDMVVAPDAEDSEVSITTDLSNPNNIKLGDFVALEGTDFGGKISRTKIDYAAGTIEFAGPSWWQYFNGLYVSETTINNKTISAACELVFSHSQFQNYEIIAETGSDNIISIAEPLGVKYSLAESLKIILESVSGKSLKFRYANKKLKAIIGTSRIIEGLNVINTALQVAVNTDIPEYFVLCGDNSKPQTEGQTPSGTLEDGSEYYPQSIYYYKCSTRALVNRANVDFTKNIKIINCSSNTSNEMQEEALSQYESIINACYGISGDLKEEIPTAEVGDILHFIDEEFDIEFSRKFEKKIYQHSSSAGELITHELGEISYI